MNLNHLRNCLRHLLKVWLIFLSGRTTLGRPSFINVNVLHLGQKAFIVYALNDFWGTLDSLVGKSGCAIS